MANTTKSDTRNVVQKVPLSRIAPGAGPDPDRVELDNILASVNASVTPLLELKESSTPDLVLNIGAISVQDPEYDFWKTIPPINGLLPNITSMTVTFPASSGGNAVPSSGSSEAIVISNDSFLKVGINLNKDGDLVLTQGTEGASLAAATPPPLASSTFSIGYVVIRTVGSAIQNVVNSDIYQYVGGGGSGGSGEAGINYFENGSFELDGTTGIGASGITISEEEASPLIGTRSSKLTSTAATGIADYTITGIDNHIIDGEYVLNTSGRYLTDANVAAGDWTVGVYNTIDSVYVAGPVDLKAPSENGRFEFGFVPVTGKSYVLRVEFTDTTAGRVLLIDDLKCSNTPLPSSPVVQGFETMALSWNNLGSVTRANEAGSFKRVGSDLALNLTVFFDGSGGTASDLSVDLPTYKGEAITIPAGTYSAGVAPKKNNNSNTTSHASAPLVIVADGTGNLKFRIDDNGSVVQGSETGDLSDTSISGFIISTMLPVSEWAGEGITVTPNLKPAQTKEVSLILTATGPTSPPSATQSSAVAYRDSIGNYRMKFNIHWDTVSPNDNFQFEIAGILTPFQQALTASSNENAIAPCPGRIGTVGYLGNAVPSNTVYVDSEASINDIYVSGDIKLSGKPDWWDANVEATSVSTVIEEASAARAGIITRGPYFEAYYSTTSSVSPSNPAVFTTIAADSHSAYNGSTGEFTTPETGMYSITGSFYSGGSGGSIRIYIDGVYKYQGQADLSSAAGSQISALVYLTQGEVVTLRSSGSDTLSGLNELNWFSMARLG